MFELCTLSSAFHVQALVSWALGTLHCFSDQLNGILPGSLACIPFSLRADQYFALLNFVRAVRGVQSVFQGVDRFASCNTSCPLCLTTNYGLKRLLLLLHLRGKTLFFFQSGPYSMPSTVRRNEYRTCHNFNKDIPYARTPAIVHKCAPSQVVAEITPG